MKTWLHAMAHRFAAAVLAVLFIMSLAVPGLTAAGEEIPASDNGEGRLIRVAFPEIPGISEVDRYGRHTGLLMDYLNEIAKYTNWEYEYIPVDSDQLVDEFLEGRFDLMGGAFYSPEFERYFAYPDYSMGNSFAILQCRRSDDRFKSYDLKSLNGMTIGAYGKAAEKIRRLEEFLSINGLNCTIKQYGNEEFAASNEMYDYLENGDVDLLLGNSVENDSRYRVVATFDAQPYYLVTVPGNTEILEGLNMALGNIMESEPDFARQHMLSRSLNVQLQNPQLDEQELAYIRDKQTLRVAAFECYPFYMAPADGPAEGLLVDLSQRLSGYTGLDFQLVPAASYEEAIRMVQEGTADILGFYPDSDEDAYSSGLVTTRAYIRLNSGIFKNKSANFPDSGLVAAALKGRHVPADVECREVRYYTTVPEALKAVDRGEADFFYGIMAPANQELQRHRYANVTQVSLWDMSTEIKFALDRPADIRLLTTLNKAIRNLSSEDMDSMLSRSLVSRAYAMTTVDMIYANPMAFVTVIGVILILVMAMVLLTARGRMRSAIMQAELEKAEARSTAKSDFLSKMSHEIRTPMNAIVGMTELVSMESGLSPETRDKLEKIRSSSRYLLSLINDILDMSRIESGNLSINEEAFSLREILEEVESIISGQAQQRGLALECVRNIDCDWLTGDPIRLRQVLLNLLGNSVKFTPTGGLLQLSVQACGMEGQEAVYDFSVRDTGVGISHEDQERIFRPFEQLGGNELKSLGTGLGLPISRNLVRSMGGELTLESDTGKGAVFSFRLRFKPAGEAPAHEDREILSATGSLKGMRILVTEDNDLNAEIAQELLALQGAVTERAKDGSEALELFQRNPPGRYQMILMDIRMPVMDGRAATRAIRALKRPDAAGIPIVAMTANSFKEDEEAAMSAGMNGFIPKPVNVQQLFEVLEELLATS